MRNPLYGGPEKLAGPLSLIRHHEGMALGELISTMKPFGGVTPLKRVVEIVPGGGTVPSMDGPGTAVVAGAVYSGQSAAVPRWLALHAA